MKRLALLIFVISFLLQSVSGNVSEKMMEFSYERLYKYELINGTYKVQAFVKGLVSTKGVEVSYQGEVLPLKTLKNDSIQIWLPLIGNPGLM